MKQIKARYGFPIFVRKISIDYLLKVEKACVSDIWELLLYIIIKGDVKKRRSTQWHHA